MSVYSSGNRHLIQTAAIALGLLVAAVPVQLRAQETPVFASANPQPEGLSIAPGSAYRQTNFVSDMAGLAFVQNPLLVNPWGMAFRSTSPFWVANNGTSTSSLLRGDVAGSPLIANASLPNITIPGGLPTGVVGNTTTDFVVTSGPGTGAASFLFASITGNISGWQANVPAPGSTTAVIASSLPGHVYTGLANGVSGGGNFLYAADFANGRIDVFNGTFALQPAASFPFADPTIPTTPGNTYHPYNIQAIGGSLYVTYAKVGVDGQAEDGIGNGFVRRFNTNGVRDLTFGINNGALNAPWGITLAPASFGIFGGALLVGNYGEGNPSIHAFNPTTGAFLGTLQDESGEGIDIDELRALSFGNSGNGGEVNTLYFTAGISEEEHGLFGSLKPTTATATSLIQFSAPEYAIDEGSGHVEVTIVRTGDVSGPATVNYNTFDESQPLHASQKSDYEIALGTVNFQPGETSKTFPLLLIDDMFAEGTEIVNLALSNPAGAGVGLGGPNTAELSILDNDLLVGTANPIDAADFFVRQHYLDFLNREPDADGLAFWTNEIVLCGIDVDCGEVKRINVSAAFFLSIEFQNTGFLVYRTHNAAFGGRPLYGQFMLGTQAISRDVVVGSPGWEEVLAANEQAFFNAFVTRPDFVSRYPATLTNEQYVDNLLATAALSDAALRDSLVAGLNHGAETRATVLRTVARQEALGTREYNAAFVQMEYFGYLRRDVDQAGFDFWLAKLNAFEGDYQASEMVKAFITSSEYRQRFGME